MACFRQLTSLLGTHRIRTTANVLAERSQLRHHMTLIAQSQPSKRFDSLVLVRSFRSTLKTDMGSLQPISSTEFPYNCPVGYSIPQTRRLPRLAIT
ncbi:unnamed protein product [Schistocephalus solidus]|uniref:Secreted protein n=1 Tax=Schistocephalus solidus TaxID=70667 RepID=A0A183SMB9_SCHSO|nr:unnamed protein product [Schistocephalus solidus]